MTEHGCTQRMRAGAAAARRSVRRPDIEQTNDWLRDILKDRDSTKEWIDRQSDVLERAYGTYIAFIVHEAAALDVAEAFLAVGRMGEQMVVMDGFLTELEKTPQRKEDLK